MVSADGLLRLDEIDVVNNATVNTIQGPIYFQLQPVHEEQKIIGPQSLMLRVISCFTTIHDFLTHRVLL